MTTNKALEKIDMLKTVDIVGTIDGKSFIINMIKKEDALVLAEQAIQEDRERIINECNKYRIRYLYGTDDIAFNNVIKIVNGEKVE